MRHFCGSLFVFEVLVDNEQCKLGPELYINNALVRVSVRTFVFMHNNS